MTENTKPGHIIRAALESVCFQIHDILHAMSLDCSLPLSKLLVDGGMTNNDLLMQTQADLCGKPVGKRHKKNLSHFLNYSFFTLLMHPHLLDEIFSNTFL